MITNRTVWTSQQQIQKKWYAREYTFFGKTNLQYPTILKTSELCLTHKPTYDLRRPTPKPTFYTYDLQTYKTPIRNALIFNIVGHVGRVGRKNISLLMKIENISPEEFKIYTTRLIPRLSRIPPYHWTRIDTIAKDVDRFIGICQCLADFGYFSDTDGRLILEIYKDKLVRLNPMYLRNSNTKNV